MAESKLRELSMEFSVDIINLVKYLKAKHESVIANQIGRSGTSIGANIAVLRSKLRMLKALCHCKGELYEKNYFYQPNLYTLNFRMHWECNGRRNC